MIKITQRAKISLDNDFTPYYIWYAVVILNLNIESAKMAKIVVYETNDEVLITLKKNELDFLSVYGVDRDFENDYDRYETDDDNPVVRIQIFPRVSVE